MTALNSIERNCIVMSAVISIKNIRPRMCNWENEHRALNYDDDSVKNMFGTSCNLIYDAARQSFVRSGLKINFYPCSQPQTTVQKYNHFFLSVT